ncbi:hypothetical protein EXIGLDRAFT_271647 [Exidia glandulosa HHB12029]|uniref:Uncharacterized protein n=1 Tax=Exidia glandulosa HHB12029 TaxID=1314781 RepID=A0A165DM97_EXIGL|nr:hypothetical protein EXIGLDRAFT_271647 [Exidia glandulosa HHB12029]
MWIALALRDLRTRYPADRFNVVERLPVSGPQTAREIWRLKCADCPGKVRLKSEWPQVRRRVLTNAQLYIPGPGDSFGNFEVHLRNRLHRARVTARMELLMRVRSKL